MNIAISKITPGQIPELLKLIREFARFEKLEHEVEATVELLRKSFFGALPVAGALLLKQDGRAIGYAIYFFTFSSFVGRAGIWLEDVYVQPQFRSQGLGRDLIEAVARVGAKRKCGRFEWMVLDWNQKARSFYARLGAKEMDEWILTRLDSKGLHELATGAKASKAIPRKPTPRSSRKKT